MSRVARVSRKTRETDVTLDLCLEGEGLASLNTGIGFLDHLFAALARHARVDLELACRGDLHVDDHHTCEDCALALGAAIDEALGNREGIARFGWAFAPMDEALSRAVVDFSGRPFARVQLGLRRDAIGGLAAENVTHALTSLAVAGRMALHVDVIEGANDHHRAEAAFKAVGLALRQAEALDGSTGIPSTKGIL